MKNRIALIGQDRIKWNKLRAKAASAVRKAIKRGKLTDLKNNVVTCVDCGRRATIYDHRDYTELLDVQPVCHTCNTIRGTNAPTIPVDACEAGSMANQVEQRPKCPKCGSQNGYVRIKTDEFVCRECGTVTVIKKKEVAKDE